MGRAPSELRADELLAMEQIVLDAKLVFCRLLFASRERGLKECMRQRMNEGFSGSMGRSVHPWTDQLTDR